MKERQQAHVGRWGRSEGSWGTWRLCIYKEATPPLQDPSDSSLDFSPPSGTESLEGAQRRLSSSAHLPRLPAVSPTDVPGTPNQSLVHTETHRTCPGRVRQCTDGHIRTPGTGVRERWTSVHARTHWNTPEHTHTHTHTHSHMASHTSTCTVGHGRLHPHQSTWVSTHWHTRLLGPGLGTGYSHGGVTW